jgi:hypothetical protein
LDRKLLLVKIFIDFWYILDKKNIYTIVRCKIARFTAIPLDERLGINHSENKNIFERYYFERKIQKNHYGGQ